MNGPGIIAVRLDGARADQGRIEGMRLTAWMVLFSASWRLCGAAAQDEAPKAEHVLVEGQVTDAVGAGQADVQITVHRKAPDGSKGELLVSGKTDALGDFKITTTEAIRGEIVVTLSKAQFADSVHILEIKEGEPAPFLGEALQGNLTVSGRVVNALGKTPIIGAKVQLKSIAAELEATTDKEGRFHISGLSPGGMELIVEAERFGRQRQVIKQIESFHEPEIVLKPDRAVQIKVIDEARQPIVGANVEVLDQPRTDLRQGFTDSTGVAGFSGIYFDASMLGVRLSHPDYVSGTTFDRQITTPQDARESTHEFTMIRAGVISGTIRSAKGGEPLQGARVIVGDEYFDAAPRDWSSHEGMFTIGGVRPGVATLTVYLAGYAPELKEVPVSPGQASKVEFALGPASVIEGIVRDDKGSPVTGAELVATEWRSKSTLGLRAMTGHDGRFRVENAPADEFTVTVAAPNRISLTQKIRAGAGEIEIKFPAAATADPRSGPLPVGESLPEIALKTLDGQSITSGDLRGKAVLVDFWATWCLPCVEEQEHFIALQGKYGGRKDFMILGISRDHEVSAVRDHLAKFPGIKWPQVVGSAAGVKQACDGFGVTALPEVFLIGHDGKVIANRLRGAQIELAVEEALKAKSSP